MNRKIKCYRAIIYTVLFYAAVLFCLLGPAGVLKKDRTVGGSGTVAGETVEILADSMIQQVFIADGGYLRYLDVYVTSPESAGKFYRLMVYDELNEILVNKEILLATTDVYPGYLRIPLGIETTAGRAYVWQLQQGSGTVIGPMRLGWQNTGETGMTNLGYYYSVENGEITAYEAQNVLMRQIYTESPSAVKMAVLFGVLCTVTLLVCIGFEYLGRKKQKLNGKIRVQQLLWMTAAPVYYLFMLYLLYETLIEKRFGSKTEDLAVYGLGIGIFSLFFTYVLFARRRKNKTLPAGRLFAERRMDQLQTCAFAGILWGCIHYMNAQYQFYQDCAYREVLLWVGFLLLSMCPVKKICGYLNTGWLLFAGMAAFVFYQNTLTIGEDREALDAILLRYDAAIGVMAVLVLIALIGRLRKKAFSFQTVNPWYAGLFGVLLLCLILFRNTRGWTIYLAVVFVLFYLFYLCLENRERMLSNFCDGVVLNFALAVLFSAARRPFRAWMFARYNFVFHTVTITATYLTLVICVLTVRLLMKLHRGKKLSEMWGTLLLYGMAVSYLVMTMSRTGYLAAIVMTVILVPFVTFFVYRERVHRFFIKIAVLTVTVLLCLPVTYCSIRLLPVYYNDPYIFELEDSAAAIQVDDPGDSTKYMTVSYLKHVMKHKLISDASSMQRDVQEILMCLQDGVHVMPGQPLVAAVDEMGFEDAGDFSNGRLEIFRHYIENWNLTGHDIMGVPMPNGELSMHAHNTYLQVIHDHGMITGLLYVLFGLISCIGMFAYAVKMGKEDPYAALPLAVFIGFAVAGLVEWLFHPCNPIGFSVMVVFAPLLCRFGRKDRKNTAFYDKKAEMKESV